LVEVKGDATRRLSCSPTLMRMQDRHPALKLTVKPMKETASPKPVLALGEAVPASFNAFRSAEAFGLGEAVQ
jgi:hypothetical protein